MKPQELYEKIEQFLNGELPTAQQKEFQQSMQDDPSLAQEVKIHRNLHGALAETDVLELESLLKEVDAGQKLKTPPAQNEGARIAPFFRSKKFMAIAAGLAIMLGSALVLQVFSGNNADPFAANYKTYPMYLETRSSNESTPEKLKNAADAYRNSDYETALSLFIELSTEQPEDWGSFFYAGLSALELGDVDFAVKQLAKVTNHGDNIHAAQAKWYLALALIKAQKMEQAEATLRSIADDKTERSAQAVELLKDLE